MYLCAKDIDFSDSMIFFVLNLRIVPTVMIFFVLNLRIVPTVMINRHLIYWVRVESQSMKNVFSIKTTLFSKNVAVRIQCIKEI
jgi:hypothetical protein